MFIVYSLTLMLGLWRTYYISVNTVSLPLENKVILLDAGHGGKDPGKTRADGTREKDINLDILLMLQKYLEQSGAYVITTRADDTTPSDIKREDLSKRSGLAIPENANLLVSIHQNSYPDENVKGAQVFYYKKSPEGEKLALSIQSKLKEIADNTNNRQAKQNTAYYILKQTQIPAVIVECGFLSNNHEKQLLTTDEYKSKIAYSIYLGILDYYNTD